MRVILALSATLLATVMAEHAHRPLFSKSLEQEEPVRRQLTGPCTDRMGNAGVCYGSCDSTTQVNVGGTNYASICHYTCSQLGITLTNPALQCGRFPATRALTEGYQTCGNNEPCCTCKALPTTCPVSPNGGICANNGGLFKAVRTVFAVLSPVTGVLILRS
jgi:hypothetical protein